MAKNKFEQFDMPDAPPAGVLNANIRVEYFVSNDGVAPRTIGGEPDVSTEVIVGGRVLFSWGDESIAACIDRCRDWIASERGQAEIRRVWGELYEQAKSCGSRIGTGG